MGLGFRVECCRIKAGMIRQGNAIARLGQILWCHTQTFQPQPEYSDFELCANRAMVTLKCLAIGDRFGIVAVAQATAMLIRGQATHRVGLSRRPPQTSVPSWTRKQARQAQHEAVMLFSCTS